MKMKVIMLFLALLFPVTAFAAMQTFVSGDGLAAIRVKLLANDAELYGWGNHADAGYLLTELDPSFTAWGFDYNSLVNTPTIPVNTDNQTAEQVPVDTTNFNVNLSPADDTLQKALDTLDELISGGVGGGLDQAGIEGLVTLDLSGVDLKVPNGIATDAELLAAVAGLQAQIDVLSSGAEPTGYTMNLRFVDENGTTDTITWAENGHGYTADYGVTDRTGDQIVTVSTEAGREFVCSGTGVTGTNPYTITDPLDGTARYFSCTFSDVVVGSTLLKIIGTETDGSALSVGTGNISLTSIETTGVDNHNATANSAMRQNTPTDLIRVPSSSNISSTAGSISMWKLCSVSANWAPIATYDDGNDGIADDEFRITRGGSSTTTWFFINGSNHEFTNTDYVDSGWHHLAWTWNATEVEMFIDNVSQGTIPLANGLPALSSTSTLTFLNVASADNALQETVDTIYITDSTAFAGWGE